MPSIEASSPDTEAASPRPRGACRLGRKGAACGPARAGDPPSGRPREELVRRTRG